MTVGERFLRIGIRVYPRAFRERYGEELIEFIAHERVLPHNKGFVRAIRFWIRSIADVVQVALRMRLRQKTKRRPSWSAKVLTRRFLMDSLRQDLIFALRMMTRRPWFTAVIVATLALGIGANSAIYSVVRGVVLQPLPYQEPESLVMVWEHNVVRDQPTNVVAPANFFSWSDEATNLTSLAALTETSVTLTGDGAPERIGAVYSSASFFSMMGTTAAIGRVFTEPDDQPGVGTTMVLTDGFWQRRFNRDPAVLGKTMSVNGRPVEIIGVLPSGFSFPLPYSFNATGRQDVWLPQQFADAARTFRGRWLQVVGRLRPGVTREQAQSQLSVIGQNLEQDFPDEQRGWAVNVIGLHEQIVGDVKTPLLILLGAVGFVLLIACANVANLLLARATGREQEIAIRSALGAGRRRVIQQMLTESLVLAAAGGAAGLFVTWSVVKGLVALGPTNLPRLEEIQVGVPIVLFTFMAALVTGALFGILPAWKVSRSAVGRVVASTGNRAGAGPTHARTRHALIIAEFALSLILLTGAGLLIKSFTRLHDVGVGFDTANLLTVQIQLPSSNYPTTIERVQWFDELVERASTFPGVTAASAITWLPLAGAGTGTSFWVNDRPIPPAGELPIADIRWIHPDYHTTMGIPLVAGRLFDDRDAPEGPMGVVVSQFVAEEFWPNQDPLGKTISMPWNDTLVAEVIGVVGDIRHGGPTQLPRSMLYWNHRQFQSFNDMTIVLRTANDPTTVANTLRREVLAMDRNLPVFNVRTMDSYFADSLAQARFSMIALGSFAGMAILLACIGIFGVMSYSVNQRTKEIGVRMALGARGSTVAGQIVRQAAALIGVAVLVGVAGSLALSRFLEGMVFEISPSDPTTLFAVSLGLTAVALVACYIPAYRASTVDPVVALRGE